MIAAEGSIRAPAIGAIVLLAGGLVPPPLARAAQRSVLDLSLTPCETVLQRWARLLREAGVGGVPARIVHGPQVPAPGLTGPLRGEFEVIREADAYRGPAGAVRDAVQDLHSGSFALVIEATRFHDAPLGVTLNEWRSSGADVVVTCNEDHSPAGVYLIRRAVFDHVPPVGYMDLKEQLIQRAAAAGDRTALVACEGVRSFPLRTRRELLRAAALLADREQSGAVGRLGPSVLTGERWASVVCEGAVIHPSAVVVESVVMAGAQVGEGAVVARSVVCPSAIIAPRRTVLDEVVPGLIDSGRDGTVVTVPGRMKRLLRMTAPGALLPRRAQSKQGR